MIPPSQCVFVKALQERVRRLENARRPDWKIVSSGSADLDRLLPDGGFRRGTLVEWLGEPGSGTAALAIVAAREACRAGEALLVIDAGNGFYPPAAASLGIDLARTVFVRPRNQADERWTMNQALRCSGVGAVLGWPDSPLKKGAGSERLDAQTFRRWQLAAEAAGALGLLLRPPNVRGHPTWAEIQLFVEPLPGPAAAGMVRRLRVEVARCRGGKSGAAVELEFDDETGTLQPSHALPLASAVAVAAGA